MVTLFFPSRFFWDKLHEWAGFVMNLLNSYRSSKIRIQGVPWRGPWAHCLRIRNHWWDFPELYVPSSGLTLIGGTQKFSCRVFLRSTEATPCGHLLKWKLIPRKTPCGHHVHGRHGHGSPVKNRWSYSKFCRKNTKLWPSLWKFVSSKKMGLKSLHWFCLKAWIKRATHSVLKHFWSDHLLDQKKKRSNDLERSTFCQQVQSFLCVPPLRCVAFTFWENA